MGHEKAVDHAHDEARRAPHDSGSNHPLRAVQQFATFHIGDLFLGVEATRVQEVIRHQESTSIPLAPSAIRGLINLRGQIVTAVDTRQLLGLPRQKHSGQPMNIILRSDDGAVSLLVDRIGDVLEIARDWYAPVPVNVPAAQRDLLAGVYQLSHGLMLALDTDRLLEIACH